MNRLVEGWGGGEVEEEEVVGEGVSSGVRDPDPGTHPL